VVGASGSTDGARELVVEDSRDDAGESEGLAVQLVVLVPDLRLEGRRKAIWCIAFCCARLARCARTRSLCCSSQCSLSAASWASTLAGSHSMYSPGLALTRGTLAGPFVAMTVWMAPELLVELLLLSA